MNPYIGWNKYRMQIENLGSIEYCEHSWVVLDKKLDQKSQNLSHKSAVHTNTTRDYHSKRQTKLSCRSGAAARILSKYQACHVTYQLKICSLKYSIANTCALSKFEADQSAQIFLHKYSGFKICAFL